MPRLSPAWVIYGRFWTGLVNSPVAPSPCSRRAACDFDRPRTPRTRPESVRASSPPSWRRCLASSPLEPRPSPRPSPRRPTRRSPRQSRPPTSARAPGCADGSPLLRSYMRFDVVLPDRAVVESAVLQLYRIWGPRRTASTSRRSPTRTGAEYTITHQNAPAPGARVAEWQGSSSGGWKMARCPLPLSKSGIEQLQRGHARTVLGMSLAQRGGRAQAAVGDRLHRLGHRPAAAHGPRTSRSARPPRRPASRTSASRPTRRSTAARRHAGTPRRRRWVVAGRPRAQLLDRAGGLELGFRLRLPLPHPHLDRRVELTEAADVSITSAGRASSVFAASPARYVRVEGITRATPSAGISFWDAEVFGAGEEPPPPACPTRPTTTAMARSTIPTIRAARVRVTTTRPTRHRRPRPRDRGGRYRDREHAPEGHSRTARRRRSCWPWATRPTRTAR